MYRIKRAYDGLCHPAFINHLTRAGAGGGERVGAAWLFLASQHTTQSSSYSHMDIHRLPYVNVSSPLCGSSVRPPGAKEP